MNTDARTELYQTLHRKHTRDEAQRLYTADRVLRVLFERLRIRSILDVGCGRGLWLAVAQRLGADEAVGVEGPWVQAETTYTQQGTILTHDLEQRLDLGRTFDLVMSIEVAEHLSERVARQFIQSLVRHGSLILFSAAIPFQPGTGHINCRFLDYWASLFGEVGYKPLDAIRPAIWEDRGVHVWIRQNAVLFASPEFVTISPWPRLAAPLSIVHPELYQALLGQRHRG